MSERSAALSRSIAYRLAMCDEQELIAIDRMLIAVEKRREIHTSFPSSRTPSLTRDEALAMWRASYVARAR